MPSPQRKAVVWSIEFCSSTGDLAWSAKLSAEAMTQMVWLATMTSLCCRLTKVIDLHGLGLVAAYINGWIQRFFMEKHCWHRPWRSVWSRSESREASHLGMLSSGQVDCKPSKARLCVILSRGRCLNVAPIGLGWYKLENLTQIDQEIIDGGLLVLGGNDRPHDTFISNDGMNT